MFRCAACGVGDLKPPLREHVALTSMYLAAHFLSVSGHSTWHVARFKFAGIACPGRCFPTLYMHSYCCVWGLMHTYCCVWVLMS